MANKDTVIALISDIHAGSYLSVCPPHWNLTEGGTYHASPAQMILYRQWVESAKKARDLLTEGRERKRLVLILNGEPIDNNHHGTAQLVTILAKEQTNMAVSLLDEWMQIAGYTPQQGDCMYLVRGTSAHERGEHIDQLGRDFDGVVPVRPDTTSTLKDGRYHWQKLNRRVNGVLFSIAHHGFRRGSRAWTKENSITYALKSMYFNNLDYGLPIPQYVIRSHNHVYTFSEYHGRQADMWGCITPCWQLKTNFGNMVAANEDINTIGTIFFDVTKSGASKVYPEIIEVEDEPIKDF
jgi:hypothetical protein